MEKPGPPDPGGHAYPEVDYRRDLVVRLKGIGETDRERGRLDDALAVYEEALALCRETGEALDVAHTVRHVGDIHRECGRLEEAEACYAEALALYRAHEDPPIVHFANALRPMAILKEAQGLESEARKLWTEARALYASAGVTSGVEECEDRLADLGSVEPQE